MKNRILKAIILFSVGCTMLGGCLKNKPEKENANDKVAMDRIETDWKYYHISQESDGVEDDTIGLVLDEKEGTFILRLPMLPVHSSYMPMGSYEYQQKNEHLVLKADDGLYTYTFVVDGDTFIYDGENSNGDTWGLKDGDVFCQSN